MRILYRGTVGVFAAAALAAAGLLVAASPAAAADDVVLSAGHTDAVDVHYSGGRLTLQVKDDTVSPAVTRDPSGVIFQVLPAARTEVPDIDAFAFLGAPGTPIWMLPQVQDPALLWPGWNTTELASGTFAGDKVTLSLVGVDGPGAVTVFDTSSLGTPNVRFRSADGLPDRIDVPVHTHAHASWVFGAQGRYTLKFQAAATLANGTKVSTGAVDYDFVVGDLPGDDAVALSVTGLSDSYQDGQQVTLQVVQAPQGSLSSYRWFSKRPGDADFTSVTGETSAAYSFTATKALDKTQYQVRLYDGETEVAASDPVTLAVGAGPGGDGGEKVITASIDPTAGALVISVDPQDRSVVLPVAQLSAGGDRWESSGALKPVTVTDTRAGQPGWSVSGQLSGGFATPDGARLGGDALGWTPAVVSQGAQQGVVAAPRDTGLGDGAVLATAPVGAGRGTAKLDAQLELSVPTETAPGVYTGLLTLTAI
ncbi:choice-of-anchor M domain-containing protein [Actinoplanes sp. RD1]|uniref:choice-of-anchor M domain-containing protein n=1 Tax=Actinoplanes sp. RD1 TaxID=3064538 RepID=UPI002741F6A8|nr:choice-of-anchor M domain-containing protein [Actinoplanes sp. RD1]